MVKGVAILTIVILGLSFLVFGKDFFFPPQSSSLGSGEERPLSFSDQGNKVSATDAFKDGIHRYTGIFLLPHSCFSVEQTGFYQDGTVIIQFFVKDQSEIRTPCLNLSTRYPFSTLVEAPEDVLEEFYINGEVVPSQIRTIQWQSPTGTFIDPHVTVPNLTPVR